MRWAHVCQRRKGGVRFWRFLSRWPRNDAFFSYTVCCAIFECLANGFLTAHAVNVDAGDCDVSVNFDEICG